MDIVSDKHITISTAKRNYLQIIPIEFGIKCTATSVNYTHVHDCSELWYALRGEAVHTVGNETFIQTAGTCVIIPPYVPHEIKIIENESIPIFSSINVLDDALLERGYDYFSYYDKKIHFNKKELSVFTEFTPEKTALANDIIHKLSSKFSALPETSFDELLALYCDFLKLLNGKESTFKLSKSLLKRTNAILDTINYIQEHNTEKITLEILCEVAGMSRSRFCENFTNITGIPPMDYLFRIRMSYAKKLFLLRGKSLSETARIVQASDDAHFCRMFKKYYGLTPSKYKKIYQAQQQLNDLDARRRRSNFDHLYDFFANETV